MSNLSISHRDSALDKAMFSMQKNGVEALSPAQRLTVANNFSVMAQIMRGISPQKGPHSKRISKKGSHK